MKRIIVFAMLLTLLFVNVGQCDFLGIKQASETIKFALNPPLDSLYGIPRKPDSVHVVTYADNASDLSYAVSHTTFPFASAGIDTTKHFSDTLYWFEDQIQDIDGAGGNFVLAISVALYYDKIPTYTFATVQIISDSLENMLDAAKDSSSSAAILSKNNLDSLQNQDNWVAKDASLYDPATDSVIVDVSSAATAGGLTEVVATESSDSTWNKALTGATFNIATSAGRRLRQLDAAFTLATGQAQVSGTPTDPGKYIILAASTSQPDDFFNHSSITIEGGTGIGQSRAIEDFTGATDSVTLIPGNDWTTDPDATSTYVISAGHPVEIAHFHGDEGLDQIHEYDTAKISGAQAIGTMLKDTLAYQGVVVGLSVDEIWEYDTSNISGAQAIGTIVKDQNVESIANDVITSAVMATNSIGASQIQTNAIGSSEFALTAIQAIWQFDSVTVSGAQAMGTIIKDLTKEAIADAVLDSAEAATTRDIAFKSLVISNPSGNAVEYTSSGGNGHAFVLSGNGSGDGLKATGGATGDGAHLSGGAGGHGLLSEGGTGPGVHGIYGKAGSGSGGTGIRGDGDGAGAGLAGTGGATGDGAFFAGGATSGAGMLLFAQNNGDPGLLVQGDAGGADFEGVWSDTNFSPTYYDSTRGSAAGITAEEIMDSASNRGFVHYDSVEAVLQLAGLHIRASGDDTAFVAVAGASGSGHGAYFGGGLSGGTGYGLYTRGGTGSGTRGFFSLSSAASGFGGFFQATGAGSVGFKAEGLLYGLWARSNDSSGHALFANSEYGDGAQFTAGSGNNKHGIEIQGGSGSGGDALAIRAATSGNGVSITSEAGHGIFVDGGDLTGGTGYGIYVDSGAIGNVDTSMIIAAASNNPSDFYGPAASGAGDDTLTIHLVDTSGVDAAISEVKVTIKTLGGSVWAVGYTSSSGTWSFYGTATDTFLVTARKLNYVWTGILDAPSDSLSQMIFTGNHEDTLAGYNVALGSSPSSANNTVMWTQVYNPFFEPVAGARLVISLSKDQVYDTCDNIMIAGVSKTVWTNDTGYVEIEVINSKCFDDDVTYIGGIYSPGNVLLYEFNINLPADSSTYQINPND